MHCLLLMTAVSASEGFMPFVQRLENSSWMQYYMFYIRKTILNGGNYQLDRCFLEIHDTSYGANLQISSAQMASLGYLLASSDG